MEDVDVSQMMTRSTSSEVLLLLLRFFNIIMSRKRMRGDKTEVHILDGDGGGVCGRVQYVVCHVHYLLIVLYVLC